MQRYSSTRASRSAYISGSAAPELDYSSTSEVGVFPGSRTQTEQGLPQGAFVLVRAIIVVAIAVALLAFARVWLSAGSVSSTIAASDLSSKIETARATGNDLEVQQSQLSNTMHIRLAAESMGLGAAESTVAIDLPADVVATDESGNLSLSGSLSNMAAQG